METYRYEVRWANGDREVFHTRRPFGRVLDFYEEQFRDRVEYVRKLGG
jgi:hypothetical protein